MKRSITNLLALLAGAYAVHGQGTVSLGNYGVLNSYIYVSFKTFGATELLGGSGAGEPAPTLSNYSQETGNGNDWTVALYGAPGWNASQNSLVELTTGLGAGPFATATIENGNPVNDETPGTWFTSVFGTISGATGNGSEASVQLAAWYNDGGAITSLAQAEADAVPFGQSAIVNTLTGGPNASGPPATAAYLPAFPYQGNFIGGLQISSSISSTPEPSAMVLGVIGASTFLMRLRRKQ